MDDGMNPDDINGYFDSLPDWDEVPGNVVQFPGGSSVASDDDDDDLPTISLAAGELHTIATAAEDALIASETPFYVRGEKLMRPVIDDLPASHGRRAKVARLSEVTEAAMIDRLSRSAKWQRWDGRTSKFVKTDPSTKVASTVLSRDGEWRFPRLAGVITTPTLRPDGTILSEPGYDHATQLLLLDPPEMPKLPAKPTKKLATAALARLNGLLDEFPFVDEESRSVALSALITPVVRGALSVAPMHVTKAPVAGSGKSYIIDLASALNSGERAPVVTAGRTEEETEKRLVAALLSGQTIISIDNVNGELGGDALCQIIERPVVSVRPLGQSSFVKIESRASCFATGNNIRLVGDMTRRVILCSLDPDMERPELREFKADPFDEVLANRGLYVAAALTVVRAYVVAGCPNQCPTLASFGDWSRLVRSALVWLGKPDPVATMNRAREDDPVKTALLNLYSSWHGAVGSAPQTASEIIKVASARGPYEAHLNPELQEALVLVAGDRSGRVSAVALGSYFSKHKDRVLDGLKLVEDGKTRTNQRLWKIDTL
jgi:putative DNA primase/helicase